MSSSDLAISIRGLSKRYVISHEEKHSTLAESWMHRLKHPLHRPPREEFWALKDVSFDVHRGEVVGIIGRNGAGKSTLLKILSRITEPTSGQAEIYGRVGSLLEVGTGFHPELTGRENVYLNGAILGMSRREIDRQFDEIVAFAEVEKFLDTPVKRYSSGMYVRLAFAVAAHLDPEILIVDEVLSVGEAAFQQRCVGKMGDVATAGRTVLFVSHNMGAVHTLCSRAILVRQGQLVVDGPVHTAIQEYAGYLEQTSGTALDNPERSGDGRVRIVAAALADLSGRPLASPIAGQPLVVRLLYSNPARLPGVTVTMTFINERMVCVTNLNTRDQRFRLEPVAETGTIRCVIPRLPLPIGRYRIAAALQVDGQLADLIPNVLNLRVETSTFYQSGTTPELDYCGCLVDHYWEHDVGGNA